jgi:hypothetical protein
VKAGQDPGQAFLEEVGHGKAVAPGLLGGRLEQVFDENDRLDAAALVDIDRPHLERSSVDGVRHRSLCAGTV